MNLKPHVRCAAFIAWGVVVAGQATLAGEPFKLGVEEKGYIENPPAYPAYPAPQMMPAQPAPYQGNVNSNRMQGGVSDGRSQRRPIQAAVQQKVVLPPSFLGAWNVQGQRVKVEALPEFQQGAEAAFQMRTSNVWNIAGDPSNGYSMSNDAGVSTQLIVDKVQDNTAFIRYQHPVGNTMAQEAIVMSLVPGGVQFNGLERVSIVKQGMPQPRAKVTYQLVGRRR